MLLPFPRKLGHAAITDPGSSPSTSTNASTSETILFFIPSSMFPAYFACLPGDQAPAFEAFRKQKSCRTQSVQQPFFCANCMPAAFSRSAAHNHLAGLLTHTSGASPCVLAQPSRFPNDRLSPMRSDSCIQCRAASFLLPVSSVRVLESPRVQTQDGGILLSETLYRPPGYL